MKEDGGSRPSVPTPRCFSYFQPLRSDCWCVCVPQQNVYYTSSQQLHLGVLSPTIDDDDNKCLVDVNSRPRLLECSYAATKHMKLTWTFSQVNHTQRGAVVNVQL